MTHVYMYILSTHVIIQRVPETQNILGHLLHASPVHVAGVVKWVT